MSRVNTITTLLAAYLAVFLQTTLQIGPRWLGFQLDILPLLAVYCGLNCEVTTGALLAISGGLFLDAFSSNPLGTSSLPLFLVCFVTHCYRDLVLRNQLLTQITLGGVASLLVPVCTLLLLLMIPMGGDSGSHSAKGLELGIPSLGRLKPLFGWATMEQVLAMGALGACLAPVLFRCLDGVIHLFDYPSTPETSFRSDREIKRGRSW